ncbi:hypothetical protein CDCA_CDCA16G4184 [Cyanidium caldarium]|uniref:B box-type domain-containing protein n=1 Tax=Cyanidium caldarium TaxID=2771 RepID=A0AAV9J1G6_CYACA|nr:hypothetical protein CDCA_CDCA16G4184 [Cyanidium caldarium]
MGSGRERSRGQNGVVGGRRASTEAQHLCTPPPMETVCSGSERDLNWAEAGAGDRDGAELPAAAAADGEWSSADMETATTPVSSKRCSLKAMSDVESNVSQSSANGSDKDPKVHLSDVEDEDERGVESECETPDAERPDPSVAMATWIPKLLRTSFYSACPVHAHVSHAQKRFNQRWTERTLYCLECCEAVCRLCVDRQRHAECHDAEHSQHTYIGICRYMYHDVVLAKDICREMDVSSVQSYLNNGQRVMYIVRGTAGAGSHGHTAATTASPASATASMHGGVCRTCWRPLQDGFAFCSLFCLVSQPMANDGSNNNDRGRGRKRETVSEFCARAKREGRLRCVKPGNAKHRILYERIAVAKLSKASSAAAAAGSGKHGGTTLEGKSLASRRMSMTRPTAARRAAARTSSSSSAGHSSSGESPPKRAHTGEVCSGVARSHGTRPSSSSSSSSPSPLSGAAAAVAGSDALGCLSLNFEHRLLRNAAAQKSRRKAWPLPSLPGAPARLPV